MFDLTKWATCRWNIDLKKFQISEALKDVYVLSNYACYNHNRLTFKYDVSLNIILTQWASNILST
jgi:hypothetical protein